MGLGLVGSRISGLDQKLAKTSGGLGHQGLELLKPLDSDFLTQLSLTPHNL